MMWKEAPWGGVWQEDAMVLQWYRGAARMPWRIKITPKRLGEVMPSTEHLGLMDVLNLPKLLEVKRVTPHYRAYRQYRFA